MRKWIYTRATERDEERKGEGKGKGGREEKGGRRREEGEGREGGEVRTASLARSLKLEVAIRQSLHKEGESGAGFQDFRFV